MKIRNIEYKEKFDISLLRENEYNANQEDTVTFERLKNEIKDKGVLQFPIVTRQGKDWKILHGHHVVRACRELGRTTIPVIVLDVKFDTPEEEFSFVNNFNLIRGKVHPKILMNLISQYKLDPEKLDLFKIPVHGLMRRQVIKGDPELVKRAVRKAQIAKLASKLAPKIAEAMLEGENNMFVAITDDELKLSLLIVAKTPTTKRRISGLKDVLFEKIHKVFEEVGIL